MNKNKLILVAGIAVVVIVMGIGVYAMRDTKDEPNEVNKAAHNPVINPADFTNKVDNRFFALVPGTKFVYRAEKSEGVERIEITVLNETKTVMGIPTVVVRDQVFLDDSLIEDTLDWFAQDKAGNVWYFGEETAEYEAGVITSTEGAWEAGINGAKPGIVMMANPKVGDSYYQEFLKGEAEDRADVLAVNETVTVPYGIFTGCVKTFDYTPLNPKSLEHKYYCAQTGGVVLEVNTEDNERTELISKTKVTVLPLATLTSSKPKSSSAQSTTTKPPTGPSSQNSPSAPPAPTRITEAQAKTIALQRVPGTVTDIEIETKFGKLVYAVEVDADSGPETDVFVDIETGLVLGTEN